MFPPDQEECAGIDERHGNQRGNVGQVDNECEIPVSDEHPGKKGAQKYGVHRLAMGQPGEPPGNLFLGRHLHGDP